MAVSRDPEFRTVRMREGYDLDAVDDFVDRVIDALDGRSGPNALTPDQIENEEFKVVRMREGYSMDDVDDWLDAAAAELRKMRKAAQNIQDPPQAAGPVSAARAPQMGHVHQQAYAPSAPQPVAQAPMAQPPVAAPPMAQPPMGQPPMGQPPMGQPPMAGSPQQPIAQPPAAPQSTGYYDTGYSDSGYYDTGHGAATQGFDPLTDTALNELDPALRALGANMGRTAQEPPQVARNAPPAHQPPRPAAHDTPLPEHSLGGASATPNTGLHHVEIWVRDLDLATRSFGWMFERLGWTLFQVWDNGRSWQSPGGGPYVVVERSPDIKWTPYDRTNPGMNHLALAVPERWMVDKIVSEAPAYGWYLMFADRHPFAGGDHHYAAYLENDEGFEIEVVAP